MTEMTNTLFRFATVRAPELITETNKADFFIHHPDITQSHFYELVENPINDPEESKLAIQALLDTFSPMGSVAIVKERLAPFEPFFQFSEWLAKNAAAVSKDPTFFLLQWPNQPQGDINDEDEHLALWDNLFYQVLSGKSPQLRGCLIEVLVANYFLKANPTIQHKTVLSRMVIPQEFYGVTLLQGEQLPGEAPVFQRQLQNDLEIALAKEKAERYTKLLVELKEIQKQYNRATSQAYNTAKTEYDANFRTEVLANLNVNMENGDAFVTPNIFEAFSFVPADEITETVLNQKLSVQSKLLSDELGLASLSGFEEAFDLVNKETEKQHEIVFNASRFSDKIIRMGNIMLPVAESPVQGKQYNFAAQAVKIATNLYKIILAVNTGLPDTVTDLSYHAMLSPTVSGNASVNRFAGNTLVLELFPSGVAVTGTPTSISISGIIYLGSGAQLSFSGALPLTGRLSSVMTVAGSEPQSEAAATISYGIKRLGIADYRQVEQTTCCYVPGEVSHIENVMAREYKEKSSRRLRRTEETLTVERQTEKEDLTDTTTTDRYEMQQQVSEVINKDQSSGVNTNSNFDLKLGSVSIGSNFAYNTSQQESNSQAITYAKDVTQRAQERVVQRVREERTLRVIDEFEEQNKHGFDNRRGNTHVSGVYRWVDKIYKNKIFNYGKRLMYEFMIPQPAVFHTEAMKTIANSPLATVLEKPLDPRGGDLKDYRAINEATAAAWAAVYNTEIESVPDASIRVSKAFQMDSLTGEISAKADKIELPDGYKAVSADVNYVHCYHPSKIEFSHIVVTVGDRKTPMVMNNAYYNNNYRLIFENPINEEVAVAIEGGDIGAISVTVVLNCVRTDQYYKQWQLNSFNAIIEGFEKKLAAYNEAMDTLQSDPAAKELNPLFYRQVENTVLRKNCIQYLVPPEMMGRDFYDRSDTHNPRPALSANMDNYAAIVKFIEQAFEWDVMSYIFYPFYWADKAAWKSLYQVDVSDPLFRSFLQSGMARVIVTVRPGFEEAVMHYIATGQVWNGGQVPVIGDDLYLSIVEELKNPTYYVEETWETRVPTTLTVIQAGSIGLDTQGLPCCEEEDTDISHNTNVLTGVEEEPGA